MLKNNICAILYVTSNPNKPNEKYKTEIIEFLYYIIKKNQ